MNILNMARGTGKTRLLIEKSAETNYPILCVTNSSKNYIKSLASKLKLDIPEPIKADDIQKVKSLTQYKDRVYLVDELPYVFESITGIKVDTATITCEDKCENVKENQVINCFDKIISSLKQDAIDIQKKFTDAKNNNDYRMRIDLLRLLKDTLNLIKEYDWKLMYSEYMTEDDSGLHNEVAVWEQNSEGSTRNHKKWETKCTSHEHVLYNQKSFDLLHAQELLSSLKSEKIFVEEQIKKYGNLTELMEKIDHIDGMIKEVENKIDKITIERKELNKKN